MTRILSPKKVGLWACNCARLSAVLCAHSCAVHADGENTSGNISPAPAFQTQAVSLPAHIAIAALVCFLDF